MDSRYNEKVALIFPLKGKILVYDAHDYNSHHRRFDYNFQPIKEFGYYDPINDNIKLNIDGIISSLKNGAKPTKTVFNLLKKE